MKAKEKKRLTADERHEQILENARIVFANTGFSNGRMKEIADRCNVDEALIYQHFKTKEKLYLAAMEEMNRRRHDEWRGIAEKAPNGLAALRQLALHQLHAVFKNPIEAYGNLKIALGSKVSKRSRP